MKNISFQLVNTLQPARNGCFHDLSGETRIPSFADRENIATASGARAATFKKILVPMTLCGSSARSLKFACNLARKSAAQLVLLHVLELNIAGEERGIHRNRLLTELHQAAELELKQLAAAIEDCLKTEIIVRSGNPAETIVQTAEKLGTDAIVMSERSTLVG